MSIGNQTAYFCWNWHSKNNVQPKPKGLRKCCKQMRVLILHSWQSHITTLMQDYEIRKEILNGQIYPRENPVAWVEQRCNMRQIRPQTPCPRQGLLSWAFWSSRDPLPFAAVRLPPLVRSDRVCAPLRRMWANESKSLCSLEYKIHIWPAQSVQSDIMRLPDAHTHTCSGRQKSWKERKRWIERRSCKIRRNESRDYDMHSLTAKFLECRYFKH